MDNCIIIFLDRKLFNLRLKFLCAVLLMSTLFNLRAQTLTSIFFEVDKADLEEAAVTKLDSLTRLRAPLVFRIFGNADISGTSAHNKNLSEKRAKAVADYLKAKIPENIKIGSSLGLGDSKQINDNSTAELKAKNRRVDIFIEKRLLPGETIRRKPRKDLLSSKPSLLKQGDTLTLHGINFFGGRSVWLPGVEIKLLKLADFLTANPSISVELQGHICCDYEDFDGKDIDLNTHNLSFTRARAVQQFLVKSGIQAERIKIIGLGHLNPVVYPEITDQDRTANRRVDVVILKK